MYIYCLMSSQEIINYEYQQERTRTLEKKNDRYDKKRPPPIIYQQDRNQKDIELADDNGNENVKQEQDQNTQEAKEIANYSLDLHKDMINTYNSVYSQLLQDISNYSNDDITILKRFMNHSFDNKNMYTSNSSRSNPDESLKLIDNVMTKNIDTFIKSIELTQKFYKGIIESYWNCIKK